MNLNLLVPKTRLTEHLCRDLKKADIVEDSFMKPVSRFMNGLVANLERAVNLFRFNWWGIIALRLKNNNKAENNSRILFGKLTWNSNENIVSQIILTY